MLHLFLHSLILYHVAPSSAHAKPPTTTCADDLKPLHWTRVTRAASFSPRYAFGVVTTPNEIVVLGGLSSHSSPHNATTTQLLRAGGGILSSSTAEVMYNDVWSSPDGGDWKLLTTRPGFSARAYHSTEFFGSSIYVMGGAQLSGNNKNKVSADGAVWYASKPYTNFTLGVFQIKNDRTHVAPWGPRLAMSTAVSSNKIFLYGGVTISDDSQIAFKQDLWVSSDPASSWDPVPLKAPPKSLQGRVGSFLYDSSLLSDASALYAYGGGVGINHESSFSNDVVEVVPNVAHPIQARSNQGGTIAKQEATSLGGRTMTSIAMFRSDYNPLSSTTEKKNPTVKTAGPTLIMTGGSTFKSEPWTVIDVKGALLPVLSGTKDVECSKDGVNWLQVKFSDDDEQWESRYENLNLFVFDYCFELYYHKI